MDEAKETKIDAVETKPEPLQLDSLPDGVAVSVGEKVAYCNDALADMLGYLRDELVGMPAMDLVHPDDRGRAEARVRDLFEGATPYPSEYRLLRKDGSDSVAEGFSARVTWNGSVGLITTVRDVSGRKSVSDALRQSEENLRSIMEGMPVGIVVVVEGRIVFANPAAARMSGYAPEEFLERSPRDLLHPDDGAEAAAHRPAVLAGKETGTRQYRALHHNGEFFPVEIWSVPITFQGKQGLMSMVQDISERKRAEERIRLSSDQLRALNVRLQSVREDEQRTIARELHDEIGQVMTALQMDLHWLRQPDLDPDAVEERLDAMVTLTHRAIEAGQRISTRLRPSILDDLGLAAAVEWLADDFKKRTGIACTVEVKDSGVVEAKVSTALFRILQEALTNVIRHAEAESVVIRLDLTGDPLALDVVDDGRGVTPEEIDDFTALGVLGMSERAAALGGTVEVETGDHGGTIVRASIPRPAASTSDGAAAEEHPTHPA